MQKDGPVPFQPKDLKTLHRHWEIYPHRLLRRNASGVETEAQSGWIFLDPHGESVAKLGVDPRFLVGATCCSCETLLWARCFTEPCHTPVRGQSPMLHAVGKVKQVSWP